MKAKSEVVLIEKGKSIEAHIVLNREGIKTFGAARFKWDWNTAITTCAATMLFCLIFGLLAF